MQRVACPVDRKLPMHFRRNRASTGRRVCRANALNQQQLHPALAPRTDMQTRPNVQMAAERICPGLG
jgi:hypothetical protein